VNQKLVRNCSLHEQIINILRFDVENYTTGRQQGQQDKMSPGIHLNILRNCYSILGLYVTGVEENKMALNSLIKTIVFPHIRYFPQTQAYLFLEPLVLNNKTIIRSDLMTAEMIQLIVKTVDSLVLTDPRLASGYLDVLKGLMCYKNKILKFN
jgi:hypothetical protein